MLSLDGEEVVEFAAETKLSRLDWFKAFLGELPKVIDFKEVASRDKNVDTGNAAQKLDILTREKIKENKELSYSAAFEQVQREHPDLVKEYRAEINP
jgi:hypothetical protein